MVFRDGNYIYKKDEFENVDVALLEDQDGELELVIDDHFSGEQLATFKVIEDE